MAKLKDQPFFLAVGFRRPHLPFTAPDRYWKLFDDKQLPVPDTTMPENAPAVAFHNSQELRGYTDIPEKGPIPANKITGDQPGHTAALTELVDLYPTLTSLCGLKTPKHLAGVNLEPVLKNANEKVKPFAFSQFIRPYAALSDTSKLKTMGYSLRSDRYRFTEWYNLETNTVIATELYDHSTDPNEMINQASQPAYDLQVKELHIQLQGYYNSRLNK